MWTTSKLIELFRIDKSKTSIYRDEESGLIPTASRLKKGNNLVRSWHNQDLPAIGEYYGFLNKPTSQKIIAVYSPKGGVLKTTMAYNIARIFAINNIKTLVIGLDVQGSITNNLKNEDPIEQISEIQDVAGLYEASIGPKMGGYKIEDTIQSTDLPTLFYIPESSNLNLLEQKIRDESRREHFLSRLIKPLRKKFDVIVFDNSPNWNFLIQNSLVVATDVICPIACEVETYRSLTQNIKIINDFKDAMELNWNSFTLIPTKLERTRISKQIETQYRTLFEDLITSESIRSGVKGQESSLEQLSTIEYDPKSPLADDYYSVIQDVWSRITQTTKHGDK